MLNFWWDKIWTEEELYNLQVDAVSRFMKCDTQHNVEATIEFARFLDFKKLNSDNYPLFLELLKEENYHVIESLLGNKNAFDFFKDVQPNYYIIEFSFKMLYKYSAGGVYERTLELIFGILYRNYHSSKEGFALHPLSIENLNSIGKFLDKSKKQSEGINRFILDILADIAEYYTIDEKDEDVNKISAHAIAIRNAFYDRRLDMNSVIPDEVLVKKDYMKTTVNPRKTRAFAKKD